MHGMTLQGAQLRHHNDSHGTSEQQAVTTDVQTLLDTLQRCKASGLGHLSHGDPILDTAGPDSARMAFDVWLYSCEDGS